MSDESRAVQPRGESQIHLTRQEPSVDEQHPWNDDKLWLSRSRSPLLADLERVVERVTGKRRGGRSLTISLDGKWGTGKTFFLKRWTNELDKLGKRAIYYNAWSDDFCGDPLMPLLSHILKCSARPPAVSDDQDLRKAIKDFHKRKFKLTNARISLKPLPLALTFDVSKAVGKADQARRKLKRLLEKQAREKPMIIIIDELDRCRPDYAVEMLERTKHLCNGQGMLFVYGINRDELIKSIQSRYGNIDAKRYIRRFFDMNFTLPLAPLGIIENYIKWLISEYVVSVSDGIDLDMFKDSARRVIGSNMNLTLRDIEQCVRAAALVVDKWEEEGLDSDKVSAKDAYDEVMEKVVKLQQEEGS